ncbi:ankyrin repeat domain-containing protein [Dyella flagellata]|uniref:Ankyrin repeat protein n=1 Tax=Dyella flagellata TaxID=1867833 RepID=A0ABQ5X8D1_9GAMM|nr:ankyrin repeat domain-containing protein [Dyella flagellata]GLQ87884.1 hypothetical protein GCM10007898_14520 [Dyella flagellata]
MKRLPERPQLDHLKKQAKDLLAGYQQGDPVAFARLRACLPAAAGKDDQAMTELGLRLHDAQSCLAREYAFPSWTELKHFVLARNAQAVDRNETIRNWLSLVYAGHISGGMHQASPAAAARMLAENPSLPADDPYLACAIGELATLQKTHSQDPRWIHRPGGPLQLPPLVAICHSSLLRLPEFAERLRACASFLLAAGIDPNQSVANRWGQDWPDQASTAEPLSALYGAAGQHHDPLLTQLLLDAGANPNDGESLYHSLENPACTRLLLSAGARVTGSNALYRVLDMDNLEALQLLLAAGGNANEPAGSKPTSDWGTPLLWAIRRRRSAAHVQALLAAGANPAVRTPDGISAYVLALRFGLMDVATLLRQTESGASLSMSERFVAACAANDAATARQLLAKQPDLLQTLSDTQQRLLPELAAQACNDAVKLMIQLGWPITVRGGDWDASALNHAVFRGDTELTRFLLEHGASWQEQQGFGDNACGTLAWASTNLPEGAGDWLGCAAILRAHGMPAAAAASPSGKDGVTVAGSPYWFSDEVTDFLLGPADETS